MPKKSIKYTKNSLSIELFGCFMAYSVASTKETLILFSGLKNFPFLQTESGFFAFFEKENRAAEIKL